MRLCISRKEHDYLMDNHNNLFKELMSFNHDWLSYGIYWNDLPSNIYYQSRDVLRVKQPKIVTPQIGGVS